mgnify:CR=1 FL=1
MNTEIKNAIQAADSEAQYDESAKRLLAQKYVLAHILVRTVEEFQGMEIEKVVSLIEGDPYISKVPVASGLTNNDRNMEGKRFVGLNTEAGEKNEGLVRFDIIFYVRMRNGLAQMIINVEAQKDEPGSYQILNRAIFYVSRLISSQKERDFVKSNYNDIKTVYSIWVCMNMPENSMCHIYLTKEDLLGKHNWKGNLNLVNIVMIGLTNALPESHNEYGLHRLLCAMFSNELSQQQKMKIMEQEYHIPMEESFKEEVSIMCNLSQKIKETGIEMGKREMIMKMYNKGYTTAQIADVAEMDEKQIKEIIKNAELLPV